MFPVIYLKEKPARVEYLINLGYLEKTENKDLQKV